MNQSFLETALNDLIASARAAGLDTDTILATLEIAIYALKEETDD